MHLLPPLLVILLVPLAASSAAYEDDGMLAPGTVLLGGFQTYSVELDAGERVSFVLAGPAAGFGINAVVRELCGPYPLPGACGAFAVTGPDSLAGGACGLVHAQDSGTIFLSHTAATPGIYFLGLRPVAAVEALAYHVSISVDESAPALVGRGGSDLVLGEEATPCAARSALGIEA